MNPGPEYKLGDYWLIKKYFVTPTNSCIIDLTTYLKGRQLDLNVVDEVSDNGDIKTHTIKSLIIE